MVALGFKNVDLNQNLYSVNIILKIILLHMWCKNLTTIYSYKYNIYKYIYI